MLTRRYSYFEPLPESSFRLLRLRNILTSPDGSVSSDVSSAAILDLSLAIRPMDTSEPYRALSYTWDEPGLQDDNHHILIDGEPHDVAPNLFNALCQLSTAYEGSLIWIDALCINQKDSSEKEKLVQRMGEVYRNAFEVIIWLGEATASIPEVFDVVEQVAKVDKAVFDSSAEFFGPERLSQVGLPDAANPIWPHYLDLYERRWFQRGWVVQEAVLARRATVFCGQYHISWETLRQGSHIFYPDYLRKHFFATFKNHDEHVACRSLGRNALRMGMIEDYFDRQDLSNLLIVEIVTGTRELKHGEYVLLHLMRMARDFDWLDPRDRIYSMIGIVRSMGLDLCMAPDYSESCTPASVLTQFAQAVIRHSNSISIISQVSDPYFRKTPNLPSWAPCLKNSPNFAYGRNHPFEADKGFNLGDRVIYEFNADSLLVWGVKVGRIQATTGVHFGETPNIGAMRQFATQVSQPEGLDSDEILWRTLITDVYGHLAPEDKHPAPVECGDWFSSHVYTASEPEVSMQSLVVQNAG